MVMRVDEWLTDVILIVVLKNILPSYCIWLYRVLAKTTIEHQYNMKIVLVRYIRYVKMQSDLTENGWQYFTCWQQIVSFKIVMNSRSIEGK